MKTPWLVACSLLCACPLVGPAGLYTCESSDDCTDGKSCIANVCEVPANQASSSSSRASSMLPPSSSATSNLASASSSSASSSSSHASSAAASSGSSLSSSGASPSSSASFSSSSAMVSSSTSAGCVAGAQCVTDFSGECAAGHVECNSGTRICVPNAVPGEMSETCGDIGVDNDCDGDSEEAVDGIVVGDACDDPSAMGRCLEGRGTWQCAAAFGTTMRCQHNIAPVPESCEDLGVDDDCDGDSDELEDGIDPGESCFAGSSACVGTYACLRSAGGHAQATCIATSDGTPEVCDDVDNNCDGMTDECPLNGWLCSPVESGIDTGPKQCGCSDPASCDGTGNTPGAFGCSGGFCTTTVGNTTQRCERGFVVVNNRCSG